MSMQYRRLGRTGLQVSAVGFGTNQLRLLTPAQAVATLVRGFELGVNIVHTSADYEGAEDLVAQAIERSGRRVHVATNGYDVHGNGSGRVRHFESLFEAACARFGPDRLDLYGIAAVEDREAYGENVWGPGGMVEFLLRMKAQGRLGGIFCTTHGEPAFVRKLVDSGVFDAIMLSANALGYHLLSLHPPPGRHFENPTRNRMELFPLCRERDIGVMVMMPLAGGLLTDGLAFPPRFGGAGPEAPAATELLRSLLADEAVSCVMPGTTSVAEAEENARAGHAPQALAPAQEQRLRQRVAAVRSTVCSRCGACEPLCSRGLPVSWLFRAADIARQPSEVFETWSEVEYFRLHPQRAAPCASCDDASCRCPAGIDIPASLGALHEEMKSLAQRGLVAAPPQDPARRCGDAVFGARLLVLDVPQALRPGVPRTCRIHLENTGERGWFPRANAHRAAACLAVFVDGRRTDTVWPREAVHAGGRAHFVFELQAPAAAAGLHLRLQMLGEHDGFAEDGGFTVFAGEIGVGAAQEAPCRFEVALGEEGACARPYGVEWLEHQVPGAWTEAEPCRLYLRVRNTGSRTWRASDAKGECVDLVVRIGGEVHSMVRIPQDVPPGASTELGLSVTLPAGTGDWELGLCFLEQNVAWFEQQGVRPLALRIRRQAAAAGADLMAVARTANAAVYSPSQGLARSRDGRAYPTLVHRAHGARIRDARGNEWVDYVMGYGSALLGYAHPEITQAIGRMLDGGAVLSLSHEIEMQVTQALCERLPCAEMVLFGKNGSDAATAAVRIARMHTGRPKVLFSGYHGWQEPFASWFDPGLALPGQAQHALRFATNDLEDLCRLMREHAGSVAAVMLEPAAQVEGVDGPCREADPVFLRQAAEVCREHGAVLIFDEIMTGFRHAQGSVQQATGVVPDLACLGKALSSGMPLSAVVGRRAVMQPALARIFYHPTFKGEAYSFAAAAAALSAYRGQDVYAGLRTHGEALRQGIDTLARELDVAGRVLGPPFRMVFAFDEPDERLRACKRTLLQQELMLQGILTFRGFMLPSLAHGAAELDRALEAWGAAFRKVREVARRDAFASSLEIDLVT